MTVLPPGSRGVHLDSSRDNGETQEPGRPQIDLSLADGGFLCVIGGKSRPEHFLKARCRMAGRKEMRDVVLETALLRNDHKVAVMNDSGAPGKSRLGECAGRTGSLS